jgi:hypothetical protein
MASLLLVSSLLSGCLSVSNVKTLMVPPSDKPVAVTATSRAQCWDMFFIMYCRLNMEMNTSSGQKVSDFPVEVSSK